jgi:hypothetical protein
VTGRCKDDFEKHIAEKASTVVSCLSDPGTTLAAEMVKRWRPVLSRMKHCRALICNKLKMPSTRYESNETIRSGIRFRAYGEIGQDACGTSSGN